ncbi:MAG TPA: ATP-binding cassette domain-containing protein [Thermoanaerobaculia bacterium]|nr:ATP-binding cassette domain-containing protein [Thermoanaerobaculia bacterium]
MTIRAGLSRSGIAAFSRSIAPYLRARRGQTLLVVFTLLPTIAFTTVQPLLLKSLVDDAILPKNSRLAMLLVAALAGLLVADALGELANRALVSRLAISVSNEIRLRLFEHVQRLSMITEDLVAHFSADLDAVERVLMFELRSTFIYAMTIVVGAVVLLSVQWRLALVALALIPLVYMAQKILGSRDDLASLERQEDVARVVATVQENIAAQPVVRAFGLHAIVVRRFRSQLANLAQSTNRVGWLAGLQGVSINASGALLMVVSIGIGTVLALRGHLSVGALFAVFELLWWMVSAVQQLSDVVLPFQYAAGGMQRIEEVLRARPAVIDMVDAAPAPLLRGAIQFDGVTFRYGESGKPQLENLAVTIPAGQSVAVVGASGCGKSTLLGLLMRFHDPIAGAVLIDGTDLRAMQQASWRNQIGTVFQESFLFNTTVRENIRLGNPDADQKAIERAAHDAEIDDFIHELPDGYDTIVGERGGRLSGGQRQRVAIARAIVRDPPILVLDEATSSLDPKAESAINATLSRLSKGRTVITVTHRLASVTAADKIIVLDRGRVVEEGRHDELLPRGGIYTRSFQRQSGFAITGDGRRAEVEGERLREIPLFAELDLATLAALANRFVTERHPAGQIIFQEGDEGDKLHIVVRGTVEILKDTFGKAPRQVAVLQDGEFFGEIALLANVPRTATARTRQATVLLSLDREQFDNLMLAEPYLRRKFQDIAVARLQSMESEA